MSKTKIVPIDITDMPEALLAQIRPYILKAIEAAADEISTAIKRVNDAAGERVCTLGRWSNSGNYIDLVDAFKVQLSRAPEAEAELLIADYYDARKIHQPRIGDDFDAYYFEERQRSQGQRVLDALKRVVS